MFGKDAKVLIVGNYDTVESSSPFIPLNIKQQKELARLTKELWR